MDRQRRRRAGAEGSGAPPRPPVAAAGNSGAGGGPLRTISGYDPWRDPTVLVLVVIAVVAGAMFVGGAAFGPALGGGGGDGVFPVIDMLLGNDGDGGPALELSANRTELTAGESVAFRVTDDNGTAVADAAVSVGGASHAVGEDGRAVVRLDDAGNRSAIARARATDGDRLESNSVPLTVRRRQVQLGILANRSRATVGEPVALTLLRTDERSGAVRGELGALLRPEGHFGVPWSDRQRFRTNGSRLTVVPEYAGTLFVGGRRAPVGNERFESTARTLPVDRRAVGLSLRLEADGTEPDAVRVDESVTATLRREDTGEAIAGSVSVDGRTIRTDDDGTAEIAFERAGDREVVASAPQTPAIRFESATRIVRVERRPVDLEVSLDRANVTADSAVAVSVTRADTGAPVDATVAVAGQTYTTGPNGTVEVGVAEPGEYAVVARHPDTRTETFRAGEATLVVRAGD